MLNNRIKNIAPSMTMAITAKAAELKAQGKDIIGLGSGEPDFNTPQHICEAAEKAIYDGITKYTAVDGLPILKEAIQAKFKNENQLNYGLDQIIVNAGAKLGIYNILQVLLEPGDEAIVPAPYWVSYPDMIRLASANPIIINCQSENAFKLTAEQLEESITSKTKILLLNSPSNPTGKIYGEQELIQIAEVLRKYPKIVVISDDIYEHLRYIDQPFKNLANVAPDLIDRIIVVNGVSKAYAMTGWRIGYCAGAREIIGACKKIQSQSISNPSSISQIATVAALNGPQDCLAEMKKVFAERNNIISKKIDSIKGMSSKPAEGAFYLFVDVKEIMKKKNIESDLILAKDLLEQKLVAVVPGSPFGSNGYMRISFAAALDDLIKACDRIKEYAES